MVFGIGEGKVDIILDKFNFSQGEIVKGKVKLELSQPKNAKELRIELKALRRSRRAHRTARSNARDEVVYSFVLVLDKEKEYTSSEHDFEIGIPKMAAVDAIPKIGNELVDALMSRALAPNPIRWYLKASLDLAMSFDINKTIQINVV